VGQTRHRIAVWVFGLAALAAAGCGTSTAVVTVTATPAPTATPAATLAPATSAPATAAPITVAGISGGAGDTGVNPDQTYICAASGDDDSGSLIAYLTVAGTDTARGTSLCSSLENASSWTAANTIPGGGYEAVPGCHVTLDSGAVTARIYTASGGTAADTVTLCNALLGGFSLPTLAP
jgi:hypothetical protein